MKFLIFRDSLFFRLFFFILGGLIVSHLVAYFLTPLFLSADWQNAGVNGELPRLMSLPPGGPPLLSGQPPPDRPILGEPLGPPPPGPFMGHYHPGPPPPGSRLVEPQPLRPGGHLAENLWSVDMTIRCVVIALFAWGGARWLSRPVNHLVTVAEKLARPDQRYRKLPLLDEHKGIYEIRMMATAFNRMAKSLRVQLESRELFLAAIAHDLRTPMSRLRMQLEKVEEAAVKDECMSEFRAMTDLLESAIETARIGQHKLHFQPIDVYMLIQAQIDDLMAEHKNLRLSGQSCIANLPVDILQRVLDNMLTNAIRYGGAADVHVVAEDQWINITINDDGPGIPDDQLEMVFEPFHRLENSRNRSTGGVGLGLYIARELMHACGGRIELRNRLEGGLQAILVFPRFPN